MCRLIRILVGTILPFLVKTSLLVSELYLRKHVLESSLIAFPHLLMLVNAITGLVFSVTSEFFHGILQKFHSEDLLGAPLSCYLFPLSCYLFIFI